MVYNDLNISLYIIVDTGIFILMALQTSFQVIRMVIVADGYRKNEYLRKLEETAFRDLREQHRVNFLSYDELDRQYENASLIHKDHLFYKIICFSIKNS